MSDRIAVMSQGKVLQMGSPVEIYERPNCKFVADFIGTSNFMEGTVKSVEKGKASVFIPALNAEISGIVSGEVSVGETVAVSIRPEKIRLAEKAVLNQNCFEGKIDLVTYIGSDTHLHISINGLQLKVWEQNKISSLDPSAYYTVGQKVWLTMFSENTLVMASE
jgi:spermidine/putrescine transport system ATP-binding protein